MLTEEQLQENGYPRPDPENSSAAKVYTTSQQEQNSAKLKSKASQSSWKYWRKLIKISTCVILQKTAKLTLQLFIYVHVVFHYYIVHSLIYVTQILIELHWGKDFYIFFLLFINGYIYFAAYEKICVRCGKRFMVYPNGTYAHKEECIYHWGKAWKKKSMIIYLSRCLCLNKEEVGIKS